MDCRIKPGNDEFTPSLRANGSRECVPDDRLREAIQSFYAEEWIASSLALLAMTTMASRALVRPHQIGEPLEQIVRIARAGRGLGVVLHREHRLAFELD